MIILNIHIFCKVITRLPNCIIYFTCRHDILCYKRPSVFGESDEGTN